LFHFAARAIGTLGVLRGIRLCLSVKTDKPPDPEYGEPQDYNRSKDADA